VYLWLYRGEPSVIKDKAFNGRWTTLVKCPRCGEFGRLVRVKKKFVVVHKRGACRFGWTSKDYEYLKKIYEDNCLTSSPP